MDLRTLGRVFAALILDCVAPFAALLFDDCTGRRGCGVVSTARVCLLGNNASSELEACGIGAIGSFSTSFDSFSGCGGFSFFEGAGEMQVSPSISFFCATNSFTGVCGFREVGLVRVTPFVFTEAPGTCDTEATGDCTISFDSIPVGGRETGILVTDGDDAPDIAQFGADKTVVDEDCPSLLDDFWDDASLDDVTLFAID
jgi:hypothetical protein